MTINISSWGIQIASNGFEVYASVNSIAIILLVIVLHKIIKFLVTTIVREIYQ